MDSSGSGYGPLVHSFEHGTEPSGSTKHGAAFFDYLSDCQLLKIQFNVAGALFNG
jgi:hypothetical protein